MAEARVVARGLAKRFGGRLAVDGVSLEVRAGEVVALVGPNGAGKTTLVRLLLGLLRPDAGSAEVAGHDPAREPAAVRARAGLLTESPGFYPRLSALENLRFFGRLAGLEPRLLEERVARALGFFALAERRDEPVGALSRGMRQKLALARALLPDPPVLLLDEPCAALAPEARAGVRDLLLRLRDEGRAILLCTHDLDEAARVASRVAVLSTRLLAFDAPAAVARGGGPRRVTLRLGAVGQRELELLQSLPYVRGFELGSARVRVGLEEPDENVPDLARRLVALGAQVREIRDDDRTLEEAYLALVAGARGAEAGSAGASAAGGGGAGSAPAAQGRGVA